MDKSWISIEDRLTNDAFKRGLENFLEFAYTNKTPETKIKCYTNWVYQGEEPFYVKKNSVNTSHERNEHDDMQGMIHDALMSSYHAGEFPENFSSVGTNSNEATRDKSQDHLNNFDEKTDAFFKLLKHAERELFPGCKTFTTLSFIVRLLHVKSLCRWSNNSFTMLMEVLKEVFQDNEMFPNSYREAWNIVRELGLEYKKIHACPNDCMLFWKDTANDDSCRHCNTPRYKTFEVEEDSATKRNNKIPAKVVRYFPLKPRLQRLFMSSKISHLMRWHAEGHINDGKLRHPADSQVWRTFDEKYPEFSADCRNVRLGLAADGFNPFKSMSIAHSTWPIVLIPYNLPPGMCMKQTSIILSILIDGPRGPGNDIDVYLQPLVDELQELWDIGVSTYDATARCIN